MNHLNLVLATSWVGISLHAGNMLIFLYFILHCKSILGVNWEQDSLVLRDQIFSHSLYFIKSCYALIGHCITSLAISFHDLLLLTTSNDLFKGFWSPLFWYWWGWKRETRARVRVGNSEAVRIESYSEGPTNDNIEVILPRWGMILLPKLDIPHYLVSWMHPIYGVAL